MMPKQTLRLSLLVAIALVPVLAALPPVLGPEARAMVFGAFSAVCHQLPERSFHWHETSFAVCQRCFGVYAALPLALAFWPLVRRWSAMIGRYTPALLAASILPMGVDWSMHLLALWTNTPFSRTSTGAWFGLAAGLVLARALDDLVRPPAGR
jgi:uncharacterized membrane protein